MSEPAPPQPTSGALGMAATTGPEDFEPLHPNALWSFRIAALLQCLLPALIVLLPVSAWMRQHAGAPIGWLFQACVLGLLAALAAWAWRLAARRFRATRYRLDAEGLELHRGLLWHSETRVLRSRVQHTDLQRGPLDRRLGLSDLVVHTAGSKIAAVRIAGLAEARARALRDALLEGHDQQF